MREQIEERLIAFADRIDRTGTPSVRAAQERQQHPLDAYAAARRVPASDPRMVDLVGALVLVEDGTRALAALWARTGLGLFEPDLAERVERGELRRPG